jgi:hypothetical protein
VAEKKLDDCLATLRKALLMFHSPTDDLVGIENASHIFGAAKHPKSFVSLAGADHLLSKASDAVYVANVIAAWAERYLDQPEVMSEAEVEAGLVLVRETHGGKFQQEILTGPHRLLADEPVKLGGLDSGPGPYDFLLAGLGACTSMTIRLVWGFLCQGSITPFLLSFVIPFFCSTRAASILPSRPHTSIAVARCGGQGRASSAPPKGLSLTDASTAADCRRPGGWPRDDPRGACHWPRSIARTTLVFG